jgi:hypothetical protein
MTIVKEFNFRAPGKYTIQAYYNQVDDAERLMMEKLGFSKESFHIKENIIEFVQEFKDQSHLSGVLTALNDLHFTILSVQRSDLINETYH